MGLSPFKLSACSCPTETPSVTVVRSTKKRPPFQLPNPDPRNFEVKSISRVNGYIILKVHYPNCKNYEGMKILVFKGMTELELMNLKSIDPHFCDGKHPSPIARFVPTGAGWDMAHELCKALSKGS